ncbi:MAG: carbohydrate ABC transporter permease [Oscillospiraceae bacterium]
MRKHRGFSAEDYTNNFLGKGTRVIVLAIMIIMVLFPLYWLASNSIKTSAEYLKNPPVIIPSEVTTENYIQIFAKSDAGRALYNTVMVSVCTTVLCVAIGSLAAYAIAKGSIRKKVRSGFSMWFMIQKMYPAVCVAIPIYLVMRKIGLIDTVPGLVIVNTSFNLPMTIWLMIGFFQDLPDEIEQSGKIDGCNMFQRFFYLALPITKPGIVAAAILVFNAAWNEFLFSAILSINKSKTLSVVVAGFITDKGLEWGPMAALSMVLIVPVVILVWILQKDFVSGLTMGSVKE